MAAYAWVHLDNGRSIFRRVEQAVPKARSSFPCPLILKDAIAPVQSMADGQWYDSMSALRRTYRADGNPQGVEYIETGDEPMKGPPPVKRATKEELNDVLHQAEARLARGELHAEHDVHL